MARYPGKLERALDDSYDYERKLRAKITRLETELEACRKYEDAMNAELVRKQAVIECLAEIALELGQNFCQVRWTSPQDAIDEAIERCAGDEGQTP